MKVRRPAGTITTYPGITAWHKYVDGEITLAEWSKVDGRPVTKQLYTEVEVEWAPELATFILGALVGALVVALWCTSG